MVDIGGISQKISLPRSTQLLSLEILDPKDLELGIALLGLDDVDAMAHARPPCPKCQVV